MENYNLIPKVFAFFFCFLMHVSLGSHISVLNFIYFTFQFLIFERREKVIEKKKHSIDHNLTTKRVNIVVNELVFERKVQ